MAGHQSRQEAATLKELADSIKVSGVIQPLLVRRSGPGEYQLVAGERRLRASQLAGLAKVPAIVKEFDDRAMLELALLDEPDDEDAADALREVEEKVGALSAADKKVLKKRFEAWRSDAGYR